MKKIITSIFGITLSLLFITNAHAQIPSLDELLDLNKTSSKSSLTKKTELKPTKVRVHAWDGAAWLHQQNKEYTFNSKGGIAETLSFILYDSSSKKFVNLFNSNGEISGYEEYVLIDGNWVLYNGLRVVESYNADGLLLKRIEEYYNSDPGILAWIPYIQYN